MAAKVVNNNSLGRADEVGLKTFAGWTANERRLVLLHNDKTPNGAPLKATQKLKTILPTGDQEGNDKDIKLGPERALITYCYEQLILEENAKKVLETPYVWKKADGQFAHVQTWTVNYNQAFKEAFKVDTDQNPDPDVFEQAAVKNFRQVAIALFGNDGNDIPIRFVQKTTKNRLPIWIGTTKQFQDFFELPGVKDALDVTAVKGNAVTFRTYTQKSGGETASCCLPPMFGCGTITLRLSDEPEVEQVLYRRTGYSRFWCFKTREQFEKEGNLMGIVE